MTPTHVEYVTFRLISGTNPDDFLTAARATDTALAAHRGYIARFLSQGATGDWTDCVLWSDADAAEAAASAMMTDPSFAPFIAAIAADTMQMRHEALHWQKA